MIQCLVITLAVGAVKGFLDNFVKKHANSLHLEGVAQFVDDEHVKIVVCGPSENVDDFIDLLYEKSSKFKLDDIAVESFFKDRDYRGIFRVIA
ncbi:acylphosphatase [Candidatus Dependentiae bacterium]